MTTSVDEAARLSKKQKVRAEERGKPRHVRRLLRLRRRKDYLEQRVKDEIANGHQVAEFSALRWAVAALEALIPAAQKAEVFIGLVGATETGGEDVRDELLKALIAAEVFEIDGDDE